ncbi:hypothetical protein CkaCkLH20_02770 [Colletotrichum karsti]|uniref:Uncharacterized protein n=1 Tax=Colletotrichum karsti TaxID=1095194 RepID=A0A9P6LL13_9PEZI|nr:uncharacterized protein CkaCkLH20_02770 [Colletotrichum karsti]KAF9879959.1 hypothetical protein CkaCkLH20_02770 [Colletotrichum karsti]
MSRSSTQIAMIQQDAMMKVLTAVPQDIRTDRNRKFTNPSIKRMMIYLIFPRLNASYSSKIPKRDLHDAPVRSSYDSDSVADLAAHRILISSAVSHGSSSRRNVESKSIWPRQRGAIIKEKGDILSRIEIAKPKHMDYDEEKICQINTR